MDQIEQRGALRTTLFNDCIEKMHSVYVDEWAEACLIWDLERNSYL